MSPRQNALAIVRLHLSLLAILSAGCQHPHSSGISRNDLDLNQRTRPPHVASSLQARAAEYDRAVHIAQLSRPEAISRDLLALTPGQDGLWRDIHDRPHVLVVTWTNFRGYPEPGQAYHCGDYEIWVTAVPELQRFIQGYQIEGRKPDREELSNRLEELLGLPPHADHALMVEMWVPAHRLFRPSADPEITDHEASFHFPHVAAPGSERATKVDYLTVSKPFQIWYETMQQRRYHPKSGPAYPWTRLGYTFDWHDLDRPTGLSEFVVMSDTSVLIESKTPTEHYGYQRSHSVDKTSPYLPATPPLQQSPSPLNVQTP